MAGDDNISFWPRAQAPGSNAFGEFEFGVSPFGSVQPFDWRQTVSTQYANSPVLLQLVESWFQSLDQTEDLDDFYDLVWNVSTATGYGLDVWGQIVGASRNLNVSNGGDYFGFEQGLTWDTFAPGGSSPFYTGQPLTSVYTLTDAAYRQLILAKALANICDGSVPSLNAILLSLFGPSNPFGPGGQCYVTNGRDMTMAFTFRFQPNPVQLSIINSGVLPVPGGVAASIVISP